jgi:8-oxo-dGTP diphosphatase
MPRLRVEQYVGQRIRVRRDELDMTQEEFGREVGRWLGKAWSRSTVSVAENGKRAFTAAELVAIAHVLQTSPTYLLAPPAGISEITMPSGATVNRDLLFSLAVTTPDGDVNLAAAEQALSALTERAVRSQEDAAEIVSLARDLHLLITRQVIIVGPEHKVVTPEEFRRGQPLFTEVPQGPEEDTAMPSIVAAIVTSRLGVLVTERKDGKPPWGFVTGEVEPGELAEDAAVREVKEETGLEVRAGQVIAERDHPATDRHMIYMAAKPVRSTRTVVGDEIELADVKWVSLTEAGKLLPGMYEPVREYLERELGGDLRWARGRGSAAQCHGLRPGRVPGR